MSNIWFTSDTHAYHKNIAGKAVSKWNSGYRNFNDEFEMTDAIVKGINDNVKEDDTLYHLGDWSFGGIQNIWNFRKRLNVKTIHLCLGNHDQHIENNNRELPNVRRVEPYSHTLIEGKSIGGEYCDYVLARDLFSSVQNILVTKHGHHTFFLSHYSHRVWQGFHKGWIHLYGHSHSFLEYLPHGKSMDVGMDNAKKLLGEYRPFSIEEIIDIMSKRDIVLLDHHNENTDI